MELTKCITYFQDIEKLAEEILATRHEIIELSKRQNKNREALRAIQQTSQKRAFLFVGCVFLKTSKKDSIEIITKDQTKIESRIKILRSELKLKVNQLRDLEHQPPVPGLTLNPLSKDEMNAIRQVMGGHSN